MAFNFLKFLLKSMAMLVLFKHKPKSIAVTGSVGKTSTKDAIYHVLSGEFSVWKSTGNYNNEIGLPLTILGIDTWKKSLFLGVRIIAAFFWLIFGKRYPDFLVLEMGAGKKGDIKYLTKIAHPDVAVVTRVGSAHMEFFGDIESVQKEKSYLVRALASGGLAVLNADDPKVLAMKPLTSAKILTYGCSLEADVRAEEVRLRQNTLSFDRDPTRDLGMSFVIHDKDGRDSIVTAGILGYPQVYSMLAAYSVARHLGVKRAGILERLRNCTPPLGRLRPLKGMKRTLILDDTYNPSPEAAVEALRILRQIRGKRRIALLGDMLELGPATEELHRKVGRLAGTIGIDLLYTAGERARFIADGARRAGFAKSRIAEFDDSEKAGMRLCSKLQEGDVVLVKGSRGMRMENAVATMMAEPQKASELLYHSI